MKVVNSMADLIGETPLVKLNRLQPADGASVYLKLEFFNPSRSVKDRAAFNMIVEAEKAGLLNENSTIIEPTSGNTGIGLAMNAAARGYRSILVMPDTMTQERINLLKAYGAEVVLTPGDEKMPGAIRKAEELTKEIPNAFMPMQFENNANPDAHRKTTAKEIIEAMNELGKDLSAFVATAGTGGTITGTGEVLRENYPNMTVHVVEPAGSPVLSGGRPGKHKLVGTSPGFIPDTLNVDVYDEILKIKDEQAYDITRRLASEEGILVGPSSGAACYAAIEVAKKLSPDQVVVCIACDTGERYLSSDLFSFE
ncbi:cysteine synthase A [Priestia megaterium]|uniref:Cysteine synthase n=1 Tax=Priestia megaterium (strain ATCC 14581 / DSM 32 / CCUG 1817 / JCM 2506 / NBRC 15308 / NCIMB 9376 / NCTC 10342 / NRRL B-14308 / VKM B-512 / Ford 19) TaxID=1348623 RepID=A0A0B6AAH9_PRIM2|nr:cysteine synthase A [Priestia megaterium]AJI20536.1 cysteine synthase A [Priestia megaterium NBRC 15308 = ATCC 14581]AYE48897.1 cysteine synthase A [Priestia megaterium NCT-2]KFN00432.1 cysteine synthase A [Priestia megaterium]KGJ86103.1 cysteine synthase [Priestia megaterium NBRC 15308 = ATCC 14581]MBU8755847.1 cysteine synthase A [Priestia megaterium]